MAKRAYLVTPKFGGPATVYTQEHPLPDMAYDAIKFWRDAGGYEVIEIQTVKGDADGRS